VRELDRYSIHVFFDAGDGTYLAVCPEFPGVSAFGDTREEAVAEMRIALELAIESYADEGWPLPAAKAVPSADLPSGEFRVRLPRSLHAQLARRAVDEGISQNQLVVTYVAAGLGSDQAVTLIERKLRWLEERHSPTIRETSLTRLAADQRALEPTSNVIDEESEALNWDTQYGLSSTSNVRGSMPQRPKVVN